MSIISLVNRMYKNCKKIGHPASAAWYCSVPAWGASWFSCILIVQKNISAALSSWPQVGHQLCNFACENAKTEGVHGCFKAPHCHDPDWSSQRSASRTLSSATTQINKHFSMFQHVSPCLPQAYQKHWGARRRWLARFRRFRHRLHRSGLKPLDQVSVSSWKRWVYTRIILEPCSRKQGVKFKIYPLGI